MATSVLTKRQIAFLECVGRNQQLRENFYLGGGTALAGFHLHHRYSEDLDFFSEEEFESESIQVWLKQVQPRLEFRKLDFQQSFNRNLFFLHFDDEVLKTEFTYFPFPRIEEGRHEYGVSIDSLFDIAVNKLFTIYQRETARDYIDLYMICKQENWTIEELIKHAKVKFDWHVDPLQLGTQFTKAKQVKDYPRMIKKLKSQDWEEFFLEEAKKLKSDILV